LYGSCDHGRTRKIRIAITDTVRAAGIPVTLAVTGDAAALAPAASLTVYRIVQEALTNVVKHARGAQASVRVRAGCDGVLTGPSLSSSPSSPGWSGPANRRGCVR
jgi:signal transduction histidine kinase